jgi:hypothetical protein
MLPIFLLYVKNTDKVREVCAFDCTLGCMLMDAVLLSAGK